MKKEKNENRNIETDPSESMETRIIKEVGIFYGRMRQAMDEEEKILDESSDSPDSHGEWATKCPACCRIEDQLTDLDASISDNFNEMVDRMSAILKTGVERSKLLTKKAAVLQIKSHRNCKKQPL